MTIIVEDGTVVAGANSYVTEAQLTAYATARGITINGNTEQLLIQAMDYIEGLEFIGAKLNYDQPLQWPRADVIVDGYYQDIEDIPQDLKDGLMEVALAVYSSESPLADIPRVQQSVAVGSISVTYESGSGSTTLVRKITNKLRKLIKSSGGSFTVGRG